MIDVLKLHAAGIVSRGSAAILLGSSRAGKSTLTARLLADGFSVLSDDVILVEPGTLLAHPSPRPMYLREPAWGLLPQLRQYLQAGRNANQAYWRLDPEAEGLERRSGPASICAVIELMPATPGRPPYLEAASQAETMTALILQTMNLIDFGVRGVDVLVELVRRSRRFRLYNGDLEACARILTEVLRNLHDPVAWPIPELRQPDVPCGDTAGAL